MGDVNGFVSSIEGALKTELAKVEEVFKGFNKADYQYNILEQ